jgi:hypothetical protein
MRNYAIVCSTLDLSNPTVLEQIIEHQTQKYNRFKRPEDGDFVFDIYETIVTCKITSLEQDRFCICPKCDDVEMINYGQREDETRVEVNDYDYVSHPMIWDFKCGCKSVILQKTMKQISIDDVASLYNKTVMDAIHQRSQDIAEVNEDEGVDSTPLFFYKFDLAKILKIHNTDFADWIGKTPITLEQSRWFASKIPANLFKRNSEEYIAYEECARQLGLVKIDGDDDDIKSTINEIQDGNIDRDNPLASRHFMYLDVNSYNTEDPAIPYPENFSLDHGGVVISISFEDENGVEVFGSYWGD